MTDRTLPSPGLQALDNADAALRELDVRCCEPGRSPRMAALAETLSDVRVALASADTAGSAADKALELLEDAGGQIGRLQIGCCAPNRLPLYAEILEQLTNAQLEINAALGRGH